MIYIYYLGYGTIFYIRIIDWSLSCMRKNMLKLLVGSLCLSAFIGIVIILIGTFGEIESKVLATTLLIFYPRFVFVNNI